MTPRYVELGWPVGAVEPVHLQAQLIILVNEQGQGSTHVHNQTNQPQGANVILGGRLVVDAAQHTQKTEQQSQHGHSTSQGRQPPSQLCMYDRETQEPYAIFSERAKEFQANAVTAIDIHPTRPKYIVVGEQMVR